MLIAPMPGTQNSQLETAPSVLSPRTEIEQRIYAVIDDPDSTFGELAALYHEARESEFNTYVRIDWGTLTILVHGRWPNGMRALIDSFAI